MCRSFTQKLYQTKCRAGGFYYFFWRTRWTVLLSDLISSSYWFQNIISSVHQMICSARSTSAPLLQQFPKFYRNFLIFTLLFLPFLPRGVYPSSFLPTINVSLTVRLPRYPCTVHQLGQFSQQPNALIASWWCSLFSLPHCLQCTDFVWRNKMLWVSFRF